MGDKREIAKIIEYLGALGSLLNRKFDNDELDLWAKNFDRKGATPEQVQNACAHFRDDNERRFMPTFGQMLKVIRGEISPKARALEAWDEILRLVEDKGFYWINENHSVPAGSAIDLALRAVGGIGQICEAEYERLSYMRHTFIDAYQTKAETIAALEASNGAKALPPANITPEQAAENRKRLAEMVERQNIDGAETC